MPRRRANLCKLNQCSHWSLPPFTSITPPPPSLSLSFFFSCVDTKKRWVRAHTQKDTYRRRETGSLNLKDFLDKVDKDIFITLLLHTLGIIAEGKNRSAKDTAQHMNVDRRHNATWDVKRLKQTPPRMISPFLLMRWVTVGVLKRVSLQQQLWEKYSKC